MSFSLSLSLSLSLSQISKFVFRSQSLETVKCVCDRKILYRVVVVVVTTRTSIFLQVRMILQVFQKKNRMIMLVVVYKIISTLQ